MTEKTVKDSAENVTDKPAELNDGQIDEVSGGLKPAPTIYDKKGVKFE